jgi:MATE family multidrug resistance protein
MSFEVGVFAAATALASRLSAQELAAHQVVLNTASMTFMVPLGISSATAVLVGQALGRNRMRQAARMGWKGLAYGIGFMAISSVSLLVFRHQILGVYTRDARVMEVGGQILLIAALFQLSDGAQTVATGALRGLGDTRTPMIVNLVGHWGIGLPVGIFLAFYRGWGLQGIWTGLSLGLTAVAVSLMWVWWRGISEASATSSK